MHFPELCFSTLCLFCRLIALLRRLNHCPALVWSLVTHSFCHSSGFFACKGWLAMACKWPSSRRSGCAGRPVSCWQYRFIEDTFRSSRSLIGWTVCCTWGKPSDVTGSQRHNTTTIRATREHPNKNYMWMKKPHHVNIREQKLTFSFYSGGIQN